MNAAAQFFDWHGIGQGAGAGDLPHVVVNGYFDVASERGAVAVDQRIDQYFANGFKRVFQALLTINFADDRAHGDVFLDKGHDRCDGNMDWAFLGRLVEEYTLLAALERGAFYFDTREIAFAKRPVGEQQDSVGWVCASDYYRWAARYAEAVAAALVAGITEAALLDLEPD